jgi:hypothetical protein
MIAVAPSFRRLLTQPVGVEARHRIRLTGPLQPSAHHRLLPPLTPASFVPIP